MDILRPQAGMAIDFAPHLNDHPKDAIEEAFSAPALATMTRFPRARLLSLPHAVSLAALVIAVSMFAASASEGSLLLIVVSLVVTVAIPYIDQWGSHSPASEAAALEKSALDLAGNWRVVRRQPYDPLRQLGRLPLDRLSEDEWLSSASREGLRGRYYAHLKRSLDICFAVGLGMLALPLLLVAGIAIAIESPGSIIYSQIRIGLNGRQFRIYKLRSMRRDAEINGAVYAETNDSRVTRVGRFLRLSRIDELPQLWNVLHGDMSMIGPRPERPEFTAMLEQEVPHYAKRYATKPGLTGWAQIRYQYVSTVEETARKLEYDLYYLKYASMALDLGILLATVRVVFGLRGR